MKSFKIIPFNTPYISKNVLKNIRGSFKKNQLSGDGDFTKLCHVWLEKKAKTRKTLLTHSCTAALEMTAILLKINAGDEIIMPSYTFVSSANAFVLRGAVPVFVDIREDTLNIDENLIEAAITPKTRAILVVHYAGIACEMDAILKIGKKYKLKIIEDAAQGFDAKYKKKPLGSIGDLGAYSFHESKNISSGEGGALLVNDKKLIPAAEIIREKGTDRTSFFRGKVDKYTWRSIGSSYLPPELIGAFLYSQFLESDSITARRIKKWRYYHEKFLILEKNGLIRRPKVPDECEHNGHIYYLILNSKINRNKLLKILHTKNIFVLSHYIPLHLSPAGKKYGRTHGSLKNTNFLAKQIIRLPLWTNISKKDQDIVISALYDALN